MFQKTGINAGLKDFFSFKLNDDNVEWHGSQVYFLRVHPKNMTILSYDEKLAEIKKLQNFLDAVSSKFSIFITDKTEDLNDISCFYKKQLALRPEFEFILKPIIEKISSIEQSSACVQRAFYIVFKAKDRKEFELFLKQLSGRLNVTLACKSELTVLMRNFLLREYTPCDIYTFENALKEHYQIAQIKEKRNRKVEENPYRESREDNFAAIDRMIEVKNINEKQNNDSEQGTLWGHT